MTSNLGMASTNFITYDASQDNCGCVYKNTRLLHLYCREIQCSGTLKYRIFHDNTCILLKIVYMTVSLGIFTYSGISNSESKH